MDGITPVNFSSSIQEFLGVITDKDVTAENPLKFIPKEVFIKEIEENKSESAFQFLKDQIQTYPEDTLLVSYDPFFKYGENFFLCLTQEAKQTILSTTTIHDEYELTSEDISVEKTEEIQDRIPKPPAEEKGETEESKEDTDEALEEEIEEEAEEEEFELIEYIPPESKVWISLGSEEEVEAEQMKDTRPKFIIWFQKQMEFYDPNKTKLSFKHGGDTKMGIVTCPPYEDVTFLEKLELDKSIQVKYSVKDESSQTVYNFPQSVWTQTEPREMLPEKANEILESAKMLQFLRKVTPRLEFVLQQNHIFDIFQNDWVDIGKGSITIHSKFSTQIKEYQSLSDLKYSKDKTVTGIDWHPTIPGIIAVACSERLSFDARVDKFSKFLMKPSLVLIWSIKDPIHPQLMLEAPDEVRCLKFNPTITNLLIGGCINGQISLWDLAEYMDLLKYQRPMISQTTKTQETQFVEPPPLVPSLNYCASSNIEYGHKMSVEDITWVPDHLEIMKMGNPQEGKLGICTQIMSCSLDSMIYVWDIRPNKQPATDAKSKLREKEHSLGVPTTFQFLNAVWKPVHWVELWNTDRSGRLMPLKIAIQEPQKYKHDTKEINNLKFISDLEASVSDPSLAVSSQLSTKVFIGTLDTGIAAVNWVQEKDQDARLTSQSALFSILAHGGVVMSVEFSPFFRNIVLTVGLWKFCIWKEELLQHKKPIMEFTCSDRCLTGGKWSISRPSVFYIGKQDGTIDVWDLNERSEEPTVVQTISAVSITTLAFHPDPFHTKHYMLAVGDLNGTLHLLILPPYLLQPAQNEVQNITAYFNGEEESMIYRQKRMADHLLEKAAMDKKIEEEKKREATIAPVLPTELGADAGEGLFKEYLQLEKECLVSLGIIEADKGDKEKKKDKD